MQNIAECGKKPVETKKSMVWGWNRIKKMKKLPKNELSDCAFREKNQSACLYVYDNGMPFVLLIFSEKKTVCFSFRKYSLFRMALRTCSAPNVPMRKARAIIVSRL
mgnify:FL=1